MASQQTPNYRLSRWAGTDRILVEEFNDNWDKIDTALGTRNCRFYTASYVGDGKGTKTWTFPGKPILVHLVGHYTSIMLRGAPEGFTQFGQTPYSLQVTWGDNSVTWSNANDSGFISNNGKDDACSLFAILEAD